MVYIILQKKAAEAHNVLSKMGQKFDLVSVSFWTYESSFDWEILQNNTAKSSWHHLSSQGGRVVSLCFGGYGLDAWLHCFKDGELMVAKMPWLSTEH